MLKYFVLSAALVAAAPVYAASTIRDDANPAIGHTLSDEPVLHDTAAEKDDGIKNLPTDMDAAIRQAIDKDPALSVEDRDPPVPMAPVADVPEPRSVSLLIGALIGFVLAQRCVSRKI